MSGGSVFGTLGIVVLFVASSLDICSKEGEVNGRGGLIVVGSSSGFRARVSEFNLYVGSIPYAILSDDVDICSSAEDGCVVEGKMSGGSMFSDSGILIIDSLDDSNEIVGNEVEGRGGLIVVGSSSEFRARVFEFNLRVGSRSGSISSADVDICATAIFGESCGVADG